MDCYRSFETTMEVRSMRERIVGGVVVPFGVDQRIDDYLTERFTPVTFRHQYKAAHRVRLFAGHSNQGGFWLGRGTLLREDPRGLYGEFKVIDSRDGQHYLQAAHEGMLRQWSIGFRPEKTVMDGNVTVHTRAELFETAFVEEGAYGEAAQLETVREAIPTLLRDQLIARLPAPVRAR